MDNVERRREVRLALRILAKRNDIAKCLADSDLEFLGYHYYPCDKVLTERAIDILTDVLVPDRLEVL